MADVHKGFSENHSTRYSLESEPVQKSQPHFSRSEVSHERNRIGRARPTATIIMSRASRFALPMVLHVLLGVAAAEEAGRSRIAQPPVASAVSLLHWRTQLERVRRLRTRDQHENSKIIRNRINQRQEASFSRLFTHETWARYTSEPPLARWIHNLRTWRHSTVLRAVLPCCLLVGLWALMVGFIDQISPGMLGYFGLGSARPITSLPIELQGTAIGLLLVFRTNNGYDRLAEARALLGRVLCLCREIAQTIACTWPLTPLYAEHEAMGGTMGAGVIGGESVPAIGHAGAVGGLPREASLQVVRYLVAFAWSLKATLREPIRAEELTSPEDVLRELLPAEEVAALMRAPSVPVALVGRIRMLFADQQRRGRLQQHMHQKLEEDLVGTRHAHPCRTYFTRPRCAAASGRLAARRAHFPRSLSFLALCILRLLLPPLRLCPRLPCALYPPPPTPSSAVVPPLALRSVSSASYSLLRGCAPACLGAA